MAASIIEYALMAGAAYDSTRNNINKIPPPENWLQLPNYSHRQDDTSGFEAVAFHPKGSEAFDFPIIKCL